MPGIRRDKQTTSTAFSLFAAAITSPSSAFACDGGGWPHYLIVPILLVMLIATVIRAIVQRNFFPLSTLAPVVFILIFALLESFLLKAAGKWALGLLFCFGVIGPSLLFCLLGKFKTYAFSFLGTVLCLLIAVCWALAIGPTVQYPTSWDLHQLTYSFDAFIIICTAFLFSLEDRTKIWRWSLSSAVILMICYGEIAELRNSLRGILLQC